MHRNDRQLAGVEPGEGVAILAVDRGLQVELADAVELPKKKVSTGTKELVCGTSMLHSRNSGESRSSRRLCSSESSLVRSAEVFPRRSRRLSLVSSPWSRHSRRMVPA